MQTTRVKSNWSGMMLLTREETSNWALKIPSFALVSIMAWNMFSTIKRLRVLVYHGLQRNTVSKMSIHKLKSYLWGKVLRSLRVRLLIMLKQLGESDKSKLLQKKTWAKRLIVSERRGVTLISCRWLIKGLDLKFGSIDQAEEVILMTFTEKQNLRHQTTA